MYRVRREVKKRDQMRIRKARRGWSRLDRPRAIERREDHQNKSTGLRDEEGRGKSFEKENLKLEEKKGKNRATWKDQIL